jgi:hypothetical protein
VVPAGVSKNGLTMLTQDKIPIFIIHHAPCVERKLFVEEQFNKQGLYREYIEGFLLEEIDTPKCNSITPSLYSNCLKIEAALKEAVKRDVDYIIVFEDDILLCDNFAGYFDQFFPQFQQLKGDCLMLGTAFNISPSYHVPGQYVYWEPHFRTRCTHGILYTKECAKIVLEEYHIGTYRGPDHKMNDIIQKRNLKSCYLEPGLEQLSHAGGKHFKFSTLITHNS